MKTCPGERLMLRFQAATAGDQFGGIFLITATLTCNSFHLGRIMFQIDDAEILIKLNSLILKR